MMDVSSVISWTLTDNPPDLSVQTKGLFVLLTLEDKLLFGAQRRSKDGCLNKEASPSCWIG